MSNDILLERCVIGAIKCQMTFYWSGVLMEWFFIGAIKCQMTFYWSVRV